MTRQEKIKAAEKRIKELETLINAKTFDISLIPTDSYH
tara:strand:+ start:494 stop:607 length:114 start_codon:yes stop_codon:yes gene_type:complete